MRLLDVSFEEPAENLALDELILDSVEQGRTRSTLRFWECPIRFVVLGTAQELKREVIEEQCLADGVPIMRRCTAGGCVLQGPGSLNFALALSFQEFPEVRSLHPSYAYLLNAIAASLRACGVPVFRVGTCDLALDGLLKVSGNAQRRRRNAILHHGTLVYRPDYDGMARYLREPELRPDYRGDRDHRAFVGALPLAPDILRHAVCKAFGVTNSPEAPLAAELAATRQLASDKYSCPAWIRRH